MNNPAKPGTKITAALVLILAATAVTYLSSINDNHRWWGDFALYMLHAKNIATGQPYSETGFIYNPAGPFGYSPPVYPPVYPALLAPLYSWFELDLYAPKVLNLSIFILCLALFFRYFTDRLTYSTTRIIVITMIAFSPWFWLMRNLILSDIPFLLFTLSALIIMDRLSGTTQQRPAYWLFSVLLGLAVYLSYGTRVLGLLLIPAIVVYDLVRNKSVRPGPLLAIGVFLVLHQLQEHLLALDMEKSYTNVIVGVTAQETDAQPVTVISNLLALARRIFLNFIGNTKLYAEVLLNHWDNGVSLALRIGMAVITGLFALAGFIHACRTRLSSLDIFVVFYIGALLSVAFTQGSRYLLPVLPAFLLYCGKGAELLDEHIPGNTMRGLRIPGLLLALVLVSYAGNATLVQDQTVPFGVNDKESTELFKYIRDNTPAGSHIKFFRPRILALFTDRDSSIYNLYNRTPAELLDEFQHAGVTHLLLYKGDEEWSYKTENAPFVTAYSNKLSVVFENEYFRLYKISYHDE